MTHIIRITNTVACFAMLSYLIISTTVQAQNLYSSAQGRYDLSQFEVAASIYLLENKTFFYLASFGAVNLKVYGEYEIDKKGQVTLYPDKELLREFHVYALNSEVESGEILVSFRRPRYRDARKLKIISHEKPTQLPEFTAEDKEVSLTIKNPITQSVQLENLLLDYHQLIKVSKNTSELRIYHNYDAHMIKELPDIYFNFKDNLLVDENGKEHKKMNLSNKIIDKLNALKARQNIKDSFVRDGKKYQLLID